MGRYWNTKASEFRYYDSRSTLVGPERAFGANPNWAPGRPEDWCGYDRKESVGSGQIEPGIPEQEQG